MSARAFAGTAAATDDPLVLFDMDGVLIEGRGADETVYERALDDAMADRGLDAGPATRSLLTGSGYGTSFVRGCGELGVDPEEFYDHWERHTARRIVDRLRSGVRGLYADVDAVDTLAERYTLGLVSNNYDEVVQFVTTHHGFDAFAHARGRETGVEGFRRRKPDPHYLLEAIEVLGGGSGVYVGDRATDVIAATRAGLDPVFVRRPHNEAVTLPVEPAVEVDSLTALTERL